MKIFKPASAFLILIIFSTNSYAGLKSDGYDSSFKYKHIFKYEINGEIEIKPNRAHFPITIQTEATSYSEALNKSKTALNDLKKSLVKANKPSFKISPSDFFKPREYSKKINLSFFEKDENVSKSKLNLYFSIEFAETDDFWARANKVADALDFLAKFSSKYKKKEDTYIFNQYRLVCFLLK